MVVFTAPAVGFLAPLAGTTDVPGLVTDRQHVAEAAPDDHRAHVSGDGGQHRLVHESHPLIDVPGSHQGSPLILECQRFEIPVAVGSRDLHDLM